MTERFIPSAPTMKSITNVKGLAPARSCVAGNVDEPKIECWCGAVGTYEELFDVNHLDTTCGGSGVLYCYCGGDFCMCHYHGELDCDGCEDCDDLDNYIS